MSEPFEKAIYDHVRDYLKDQSEAFIDFILLVYPNTAVEFVYDNEVGFEEFVESVTNDDVI